MQLTRSRARPAVVPHQTTDTPPLHVQSRCREIRQGNGHLPTFRFHKKHTTSGEDVQAYFKVLGTKISLERVVDGMQRRSTYGVPLTPMPHVGTCLLTCDQELHKFHTAWLKRKGEEQRDIAGVQESGGEKEKGTMAAKVPAEAELPSPPLLKISHVIDI